MLKKIIVIGAGGHGRVISDIIRAAGDDMLGFLDDDRSKKDIIGDVADYYKFPDVEFIIGIGDTKIREKLAELPVKWYKAIHPSAVVSQSANIGEGTVVMPNVVINNGAIVGKHCIINTSSVIEHDNLISDFVHISVGTKLGGMVSVDRGTWVGIGAIVSNNVNICGNCMIGAGSVVVHNITKEGVYYGVPATLHVRGE